MTRDTKNELLQVAQELIQEKGYHAFSFKDVASRVGISTASMHYHFPSKPDLAVALLQDYRTQVLAALDEVNASQPTAMGRLDGLTALFSATHELGRMCLCGTLAADLNTLPESVHDQVSAFYDSVRDWIAAVVSAGSEVGELRATDEGSTAEAILGLLEGALLSARVRRSSRPLNAAKAWIRESLVA